MEKSRSGEYVLRHPVERRVPPHVFSNRISAAERRDQLRDTRTARRRRSHAKHTLHTHTNVNTDTIAVVTISWEANTKYTWETRASGMSLKHLRWFLLDVVHLSDEGVPNADAVPAASSSRESVTCVGVVRRKNGLRPTQKDKVHEASRGNERKYSPEVRTSDGMVGGMIGGIGGGAG